MALFILSNKQSSKKRSFQKWIDFNGTFYSFKQTIIEKKGVSRNGLTLMAVFSIKNIKKDKIKGTPLKNKKYDKKSKKNRFWTFLKMSKNVYMELVSANHFF